jgi:hypothetical protein
MQREQKKEQENFDSLKGELDSLSKSSSQYKQIQKEMKVSQTRMTALMNRSMKCFQQVSRVHSIVVTKVSSIRGTLSSLDSSYKSKLNKGYDVFTQR